MLTPEIEAELAGYSREQEFQADELGVRYLSRASYDPLAMARFLEKLQAETVLQAPSRVRRLIREGVPGVEDAFVQSRP